MTSVPRIIVWYGYSQHVKIMYTTTNYLNVKLIDSPPTSSPPLVPTTTT